MKAAKRGIWKSTELRRLFADAGLQVSAGKMSALWTGTELIRAALDSPDAAVALAVALVAFHALTSKQIGDLRLADIIDGRLTLGGRVIPLATPVRVRLAAWLDHRARTWPGSINPYLFINRKTAPRLTRAGRYFPGCVLASAPSAARGPYPQRDPRHRRRRPPHLRPVRTHHRRRTPLRDHLRHSWRSSTGRRCVPKRRQHRALSVVRGTL